MSIYTSTQYKCDICGAPFDVYPHHTEGIILNTGGFDLDGIMDICPSCASRLTNAMKNEIESIRLDAFIERIAYE